MNNSAQQQILESQRLNFQKEHHTRDSSKSQQTIQTLIALKKNRQVTLNTHQTQLSLIDFRKGISENVSNIESPAKSSLVSVDINQFDNIVKSKVLRPDMIEFSAALEKKLTRTILQDDETVLYMMILIQLFNTCYNYDILTKEKHQLQFWIALIIEWIVSIYFVYDTYVKLSYYQDDEFHFNIIINTLSGPVQFIFDIAFFIRFQKLYWLSFVLKSLRVLATNFQKQILNDIYKAFMYSLPLIFSTMVYFFIFVYLSTLFYSNVEEYFGDFSISSFTLLRVATIDGWGDITRQVMQQTNNLVILFMFSFISIISIFFWYLIQGFQIDVLIIEELQEQGKIKIEDKNNSILETESVYKEVKQHHRLYNFIFGMYYSRFIFVVWMVQLYMTSHQINLNHSRNFSYITFIFFINIIYSIHFLIIYMLYYQQLKVFSTFKKLQLIFHISAGPISLLMSLYELFVLQHLKYSPMLLLTKIFTNQNIRDISYIALQIFQQSLSPYICMLALTFLVMTLFKLQDESEFDEDLANTLLYYLQVFTLDDWDGSMYRGLVAKQLYFQSIIQVLYMLITNFLLVPAFIALACEQLLGIQIKPRLQSDDLEINLFEYFDTNPMTFSLKEDSVTPKKLNIHSQKRILAILLKNKKAIFNLENKEHPKLLKQTFIYLNKISKFLQFPKESDLSENEIKLLDNFQNLQTIEIQYGDTILKINSKNLRLNYIKQ
ncbi:hypothetical protein pb186bvf_009408 [Paramecium bursaria]